MFSIRDVQFMENFLHVVSSIFLMWVLLDPLPYGYDYAGLTLI